MGYYIFVNVEFNGSLVTYTHEDVDWYEVQDSVLAVGLYDGPTHFFILDNVIDFYVRENRPSSN